MDWGRHLLRLICHSAPVKLRRSEGLSTLNGHEVDRRVLASSVHFEIEFEPLAFVDALQAGPLYRADMDKRVGLSVITHQEAKAFHRIEELDCARGFFACEFTLRRRGALFHSDDITDHLNVLGRNLAAAVDQVEFQLLTFRETFKSSTLDRADVNEHIFTAGFLLDKAKTLLAIEEFHGAFASANDLRRHTVETATAATTAAARAITMAASWAATKAVAATAAETVSTASAAVAIAAAIISTTEIVARGRKSTFTAAEWIEAVLAESVALVTSTATSSIVPHNSKNTLSSRSIINRTNRVVGTPYSTQQKSRLTPEPHLSDIHIA